MLELARISRPTKGVPPVTAFLHFFHLFPLLLPFSKHHPLIYSKANNLRDIRPHKALSPQQAYMKAAGRDHRSTEFNLG